MVLTNLNVYTLLKVLKEVTELDPEFILRLAYYVRHKMYLRSVSLY